VEEQDEAGIIRREPVAAAEPAPTKAPADNARPNVSSPAELTVIATNGNGSLQKLTFVNTGDAPACADCGAITVRSGSCYKCLNCGATTGCS
jgi:ribonucleoside-diphosphate reductase alpha chain